MDERELKEYRALQREISELRQEKEQLEAGMLGAVKYEGMPGSGEPGDPVGNLAAMLSALDAMLAEKIDLLIIRRTELEKEIGKLPDSRSRRLIRLRYVYGKRWEDVAKDLGYDLRWVLRLHRRALKKMRQNKNTP